MKKSEIKKLEDKDLQLRYFLGGLHNINDGENHLCNYWTCEINCSCSAVSDDEKLNVVKNFVKKHNITNERFLKLSYNYLNGAIMKYHGTYSQLFLELEEVIRPYEFIKTKTGEIPDNDFREKELEELVFNAYNSNSIIGDFIKKYNLTINDFIILAKTSLNYNFYGLNISNPSDTFGREVVDIIDKYGLNVTREYAVEYRNKLEMDKLVVETKSIQKKYLELMKKLLIKDPDLAIEILIEELYDLGFTEKKDVKKLLKKSRQRFHL